MMTTRSGAPILLTEINSSTAAAIVGDLDQLTEFGWIERNSREIKRGDLFIAVKGEVHDGHSFVGDAADRGAAAALVSRAWAAENPDAPLPLIVVDDPVEALQQIASRRRCTLDLLVVGITGSLGKTSTKETIAAVLSQRFRTYRSPGNMNSEIGLPLSLLEITPGTEIAVLEIGGAYAPGEVGLLAEIAKPRIGVVTNVHPIHLERMGSIDAIAATKAELPAALPADGYAVLNGDDARVRAMRGLTRATPYFYGLGPRNDLVASEVETHGSYGIAFSLEGINAKRRIELPLMGAHSVELVLAALATGHLLGMELEEMLTGLSDRSVQVRLVQLPGPNGSSLIDDTYNASAPSVLSALRVLEESPAVRRFAILGGMRELGDESAVQHRLVGERVARSTDVLYTYGALAELIGESAAATATAEVDGRKLRVQNFSTEQREELIALLLSELRRGDLVLLKGSRGLEMEHIVQALTSVDEGASQQA